MSVYRADRHAPMNLFITASMDDYAEENRRQFIVRSGKSEAELTDNKRLRSRYFTAEANYRQTGSIATCVSRPKCQSVSTT